MLEYMGVDYGVISSQDIKNGALEDYDILICPGGSGSPLEGLGSRGADKVQDFVRRGGDTSVYVLVHFTLVITLSGRRSPLWSLLSTRT